MCPIFSINNPLDALRFNSEAYGERAGTVSLHTTLVKLSYFFHLRLRKLVGWGIFAPWLNCSNASSMERATRLPTLRHLIGHIVGIRSNPKVKRITAQAVVAFVEAMKFSYCGAPCNFIRTPVGAMAFIGAVPIPELCANPLPTLIESTDFNEAPKKLPGFHSSAFYGEKRERGNANSGCQRIIL